MSQLLNRYDSFVVDLWLPDVTVVANQHAFAVRENTIMCTRRWKTYKKKKLQVDKKKHKRIYTSSRMDFFMLVVEAAIQVVVSE
jgi:hypothetical protein